MTQLSGATAFEKPIGGSVSSPKKKRQIVKLGTIDTSEGRALVFYVVEQVPPPFDGTINVEASNEDSDKCPKCKARLVPTETHRQAEGDITHWSVVCPSCGITGVVWND